MKMFRFALAGILPAFVLLVGLQSLARAASTPPPPVMQSWLTSDDAVNHHIWQPKARLGDGFSLRQLAFEDRVAYQRAIEEVYWRHRIWPKERPDPKPALDAVMSQATIEKKAQDYLRSSELLEQEWQKPITPEQLQAEMERMAQHTKQPEVLRELFAALGNDPFVIAECLGRPVLAERLQFATVESRKEPLESESAKEAQNQMPNVMATADASYTLPAISDQPNGCIDDSWTATSTANAPTGRYFHTAVWTGTEMIVWGGGFSVNTGGRYNPSTDSWTATSTTNAPTGRSDHTAVWTGSEMIVWGGCCYLKTGGRYNPTTDSWTATSTTNAPTARVFHTAVWTGSEMIVWGGEKDGINEFNTGGRYNPSTDSWTATNTTNAPTGRWNHTAVWTGSEMIVWGGLGDGGAPNTGGRYNPSTDSWTATSTTNAPTGRWNHTAVWTGSEMIVWGGCCSLNTGGRYDPSTDSWTLTTTSNAPTGRNGHTAAWTGGEMIVWGGGDNHGEDLNTGGRYDPSTDSWTATTTTNAPTPRFAPSAVWTDSEMIVWGGYDGINYLNTGGRYCAQAGGGGLTLVSAASRKDHGNAGTFDIDLPFTGETRGVECRVGNGGTFLQTIVFTFSEPVTSVSGTTTTSCGSVNSTTISGSTVTVELGHVNCDGSDITVTVPGVNGASGSVDASATMTLRTGDVNADGVVNNTDLKEIKMEVGRGLVTEDNSRDDITVDGKVNHGDTTLEKSKL